MYIYIYNLINTNMNNIINNIRNKTQQKNEYTDKQRMNKEYVMNDISADFNKKMINYDTLFEMANEIPMYLYKSKISNEHKVDNKVDNQLNIKNFFDENILLKIKDIFDSITYNSIVQNFRYNMRVACNFIRMIYILKYYEFEVLSIKNTLDYSECERYEREKCLFDGICRKRSKSEDQVIWLCEYRFYDENDYEDENYNYDDFTGLFIINKIYKFQDAINIKHYGKYIQLSHLSTSCEFVIDFMEYGYHHACNKYYDHYFKLKEMLENNLKNYTFVEIDKYISELLLSRNNKWRIVATSINDNIEIYIFHDRGKIAIGEKYKMQLFYNKKSNNIIKTGKNELYYIVKYDNLEMINNVIDGITCYHSLITNHYGWLENGKYYNDRAIVLWLDCNVIKYLDEKYVCVEYLDDKYMENGLDINITIIIYMYANLYGRYIEDDINSTKIEIKIQYLKSTDYLECNIINGDTNDTFQYKSFVTMINEFLAPVFEEVLNNKMK